MVTGLNRNWREALISTGRTEEMHSSLDCSVLPISSLELDFLVNIRTWEEFIPVYVRS